MTDSEFIESMSVKIPFSGCWLWIGYLSSTGYGRMRIAPGRQGYAHRVSYKAAHSEIPEGMEVRHSCDTPCCVNPYHLSIGTHAENMADMAIRNRRKGKRHFNGPRGETCHFAELTEAKVIEIRQRYAAGELQDFLAASFGVSQPVISRIVRRKIWKHIRTEQ